jgi:serine/threonine-protein kinase
VNCASCGAPLPSGQSLCDACHGLAAPEPRASPGIAGFKVAHELGAGRFSQTWLVRDEGGSPLVLKLLRRYAPDSATVQRFIDEARRVSRLPGHPSLARPLAAGVHLVSAFFLVYQSGGQTTLADELRQRGRVAPGRALELCAQLCEALAVLHLENLTHLDLKPANVGLVRAPGGEERAILLDAYTRHLLTHVALLDGETLPQSSAAYAAPEPVPDARSDLYSLGALLFHLVSGRLPVVGTTAEELLEAHQHHSPLRLADVGRAVPPELEDLLANLLSKEPTERPSNALQLALALRALIPVVEGLEPTPPVDAAEVPEADEPAAHELEAVEPEAVAAEPPASVAASWSPPLLRIRDALAARARALQPKLSVLAARARRLAVVLPALPRRKLWPALALAAAAVLAATIFWRGRQAPDSSLAVSESTPVLLPESHPKTAGSAAEAGSQTSAVSPAVDPDRAPSRHAKSFERAQRALWTNRPEQAIAILRPLLAQPLSRRDRARAEHMMGDANAKQGKKAAAARWYSRSLQLSQR